MLYYFDSKKTASSIKMGKMLSTIVSQTCPDNFKNILSNFKNYNKMSDLFNILNRDQNGNNSFLNPAQQKLYEAYAEQLNNLNL